MIFAIMVFSPAFFLIIHHNPEKIYFRFQKTRAAGKPAAQAINKPQEELFTRPWLSLWESCRHSRLRGEILRFSGSEMIKQRD
ncbi:MAG: hypothetical protein IJO53_01340 [Clostridia bacterium]|nr:hypothetical protein [Clostridia bacterium]